MKTQTTLAQLQTLIATYVDRNKIANTTFEATKNNIVGLVDKIGKIVTLDTSFFDKLTEMNGEDLPLGKTIEEYYMDLVKPYEFAREDSNEDTLKFYSPSHRPVAYSYSLGKKTFPISIPNDDIERAVNNIAEYEVIVGQITKRLNDSVAIWKYGVKRELLGKIIDMVEEAQTSGEDVTGAQAYDEGNLYASEGKSYIAVATTTDELTIAQAVDSGILVELKMKKVLPIPTDTETGENFIQACLEAVEVASDVSEGYSLNGNTIGAEMGLRLYVKQGVMPSVQVKTIAGAFHKDELVIPAKLKVIKDFGKTTSSNCYAVLMDSRGARLHEGYNAVREQFNGAGDFLTLFHHLECTAFASRNTFLTIFVAE